MSNGWPLVPLRQVLIPVERSEDVDPAKEYRLLGIRLDGAGPFLRETKLGSQSAATKLARVEADDFIYSRLFAWRGAFGVISEDLDGCYVSGEFPTFTPVTGKLNLAFLRYWFRLPATLEAVEAKCSGSTPLTRNRFKEQFFLALEIPLPPLAEQQRIVARIEALAARIAEARGLRQAAVAEAEALSKSMLSAIIPADAQKQRLADLIRPGSTISYGVLVPGPDTEDGVPFVRVQDLAVRNQSDIPNKRIAADIDAQYTRTRLEGGEVLIGVVGSIGKVGIAPPSWAGANIARAVCRIIPGPLINRDYLAQILQSQDAQSYFQETTRTLAQPTLNVRQLSR